MKFKITATSLWYMCEDKVYYEKILKLYPRLKEFGFDNGYITINSLQDLMILKEAVGKGNELIISRDTNGPSIEIYDDYREQKGE